MSAIMAQTSSSNLVLEQLNEGTLSLEGWKDIVKKPLNFLKKMVSGKTKSEVERELEGKIERLVTERKRLEACLKQLSKSDFKQQKINLEVGKYNTTPKTIEGVHKVLAENNAYLADVLAKMKAAKTKEEVLALQKKATKDLAPELKGGVQLVIQVTVTKSDIMKVFEGTIQISKTTEAMLRHLLTVEMASPAMTTENVEDIIVDGEVLSTEGLKEFLTLFGIAMIAIVISVAIGLCAMWIVSTLFMIHPLLGVLGLAGIFAGAAALEESNSGHRLATEDLAMEGFKEAILNPAKTIKAHFNTTNEDQFRRELAEKRAVIANERKNLGKVKAALVSSKVTSQVIKMGSLRKHLSFSARTPDEVVAGLAKHRKMIETSIKEFEKAKTKDEAKAIESRVMTATHGKGSMPDELTFTKTHAQAYVSESIGLLDALEHFIDLTDKAHEKLSTEGIGSFALGVGRSIIGGLVVATYAYVANMALFAIAGAAAIVSPFLGLAIGLMLFGVAIKGAHELGKHLIHWVAGDYEKPRHLTAV